MKRSVYVGVAVMCASTVAASAQDVCNSAAHDPSCRHSIYSRGVGAGGGVGGFGGLGRFAGRTGVARGGFGASAGAHAGGG